MKRLLGDQGFSLIENILSVVILGVGLLAGSMAMQNVTLNTVNGDMNTVATNLANEKLEMILADNQYLGFDYLGGDETYPSEQLETGYQRKVSILEVDTTDLSTPEVGSGLKKVEVHVHWGDEDYQQVTVSTLVSDYIM